MPGKLIHGLGGVARGAVDAVGASQDENSLADLWVDFLLNHVSSQTHVKYMSVFVFFGCSWNWMVRVCILSAFRCSCLPSMIVYFKF